MVLTALQYRRNRHLDVKVSQAQQYKVSRMSKESSGSQAVTAGRECARSGTDAVLCTSDSGNSVRVQKNMFVSHLTRHDCFLSEKEAL